MKPTSVETRAKELGTDKQTLVRALKLLSSRATVRNYVRQPARYSWGGVRSYPKKPLLTLNEASALIGVDPADANREIKATYPKQWTRKTALDAMFAFAEREGRLPQAKDMRVKNGMPSEMWYRWIPDSEQLWRDAVSPRDWWERQIAKDKRCTPEMALTLRNVLARKEAIERIGFHNYVNSGMATLVDSHPEFGELYELPGETEKEPMKLLKVVNSTAEPDGSFSDYYLRVPPEMTDVREAVKWTFNGNEALGELDYRPLVET